MSKYNVTSTVFLVTIIVSLAVDGMFSVPLWWYISVASIYLAITAYGAAVLSFGYFVPVHSSGQGTRLSLTFDDGPVPGKTERILDILKEHNVKAAFFCIGNRVDGSPELASRIHEEGHLIGNHTYWHGPLFDLKSSSMMHRELADTEQSILRVTGRRPRFFRPPYGVTNPMLATAVRKRNYTVVGWTIRSFDTVAKDSNTILRRVSAPVNGGEIILFHDHSEHTISLLSSYIRQMKEKGLQLVRVDELIGQKGYA